MIWKYPKEFDDFIRANAPGHHDWELAEMARAAGWDVRENQVKCYRYNHKIRNGFKTTCEKRPYFKIYSQEVVDYLAEIVDGRLADELADMINEKFGTNYTADQIRSLKKNHHLRSNIDTRFLPGSANKKAWFKKGTHHSPENEFKPGHKCYNLAQVGDSSRGSTSVANSCSGSRLRPLADPSVIGCRITGTCGSRHTGRSRRGCASRSWMATR